MFLPKRKDRSFTPVVNRRKNYNSVYFNVCVFVERGGGGEKTKVSGTSGGRSSLNLICTLCLDACDSDLRCRQVSEYLYIFKGFVTCLCVMTSWILFDIH